MPSATKRQKVVSVIVEMLNRTKGSLTINSVHFYITGIRAGGKWHTALFSVSKSTIRRAFDDICATGEYEMFYPVGHCYDEIRIRKV